MERRVVLIVIFVIIIIGIIAGIVWTVPAPETPGEPGLARDGAFGFPQADAAVLIDNSDYRVSLFNDDQYLYVQAIVWRDADDALGQTQDGRAIGDRTYVHLDADGDGAITPDVDRIYTVNIWPRRTGLHYQVHLEGGKRTHIEKDSAGRASIRHVETADGAPVRVDSLLIPLAEIDRRPGQSLRLAVWSRSEHPDLTFNSLGVPDPPGFGGSGLPGQSYHVITLIEGRPSLDAAQVPRGRDGSDASTTTKPLPKVGTVPPEFAAADWINADGPLTLAGLRGQVVLIDFWSTNCGDCLAGIPHLNDLQEQFGPRGFKIVAFAVNSRQGIEWFMKEKQPIAYTVGTGSDLRTEYGVQNVPYAFLVGRDGNLVWHGKPAITELAPRINAALGPE